MNAAAAAAASLIWMKKKMAFAVAVQCGGVQRRQRSGLLTYGCSVLRVKRQTSSDTPQLVFVPAQSSERRLKRCKNW